MFPVKVDSFKGFLLLEPNWSQSGCEAVGGCKPSGPCRKQCDCAVESRGPPDKEEGLITRYRVLGG